MSEKKKKNTGRTVLKVLLALVLIGTALIAAGYFGIKNYDNPYDRSSTELIEVDIEKGSGTTAIANQLEGMNLSQIAEKLAKDGMVASEEEFIKALDDDYDYAFLPKNGYAVRNISAKGNRLEGYLYPETYRIAKGADAHTIINTMLSYFKNNVYDKLNSQVPSGYTMHDIVTLASLIEEECGAEKDRKTIAGVFWNRLNLPMRLQSDVTIHYILGNDRFDIELDSPYNTYKVDGLPAGPICSPGYNSLYAAIHPEYHNYYYFVLKGDRTGECNFAETYAEHLVNVNIYNSSPYNY